MPTPPEELREAILRFLASARQPVLLEPGEPEWPLEEGSYSVDLSTQGVRLHAWSESRSYSRRVIEVGGSKPGRLELRVARMGLPPTTVTLLDALNRRHDSVRRQGARAASREEFRAVLSRQLPTWRIEELTTAPDLSRSLSPAYPRALLRRGGESMAAIQAPAQCLDPEGALTFGLIWLDYLRRRERAQPTMGLALFLPEPASRTAALRIRWLDPQAVSVRLFVSEPDAEREVDPRDWGNLHTSLLRAHEPPSQSSTPEAEMEAALRRNLPVLDAAFLREPVYRQTPAIAGAERGVLDLLACECDGRLAVIELKASEDIHLPLQALDYWMRVAWHRERGDFSARGYFPGMSLREADPNLYLVAPALNFHPSTGALLRFLDRRIPVTRLGIGANWRDEMKVISRQERNEYHRSTS